MNSQHLSKNVVAVTISRGKLSVCVVGVYFEGDLPLENYLSELRNAVESAATPNIVIGGDVNAASHWWGCSDEDTRGSDLVDLLSKTGLNVLNRGSVPTFHTYRGDRLYASIVDITACSDTLLAKAVGWEVVLNDAGLSDHRKIRFWLTMTRQEGEGAPRTTRRFNTRKADWAGFAESLSARLAEANITVNAILATFSADELEALISRFVREVLGACEDTIPPCATGERSKRIVWWPPELDVQRCKVKTLRKRIAGAHPGRKKHVYTQYSAKDAYKLQTGYHK